MRLETSRSQVKGTLLLNFRGYIEARGRPGDWLATLDRVTSSDREVLSGLLISAGWYPVGTWNRGLDAYLATSTGSVPPRGQDARHARTAAIARYVAEQDFSTIFKTLLRMGSVEFILGRADSLWTRYFDTGRIVFVEKGARRWRLALEAPTGVDEGAGEATCNAGVSAWMTHALGLAGAKAQITHPRCRFVDSAARCEYVVTW